MTVNCAPIVEVLFDGTNWTDITRFVKVAEGIDISRGREDNQDEIQPGSLSLSLINDGRFTPGLASSPYYPNVKKGRIIRCRMVYWATNLVTNPSFESGTGDWSAAGTVAPALAQSTTHVQSGSQALRVTWGTGGTGPAAQTTIYGLEIGNTYTASAYVWVTAGTPAVRLGISGGTTGTSSSLTGAFQRITVTFTATSNFHVLQLTPATSPTSGQQCWIDAVQVEAGSSATTFSSSGATLSTRYIGHVNEWPVEWDGGVNGLVVTQLTATDLLKRLGGLAPMRSLLEEEMLYLAPDAYYTLGEESDSTTAGDTSGNGQAAMTTYQVAGAGGAITFGGDDGPGTDDLPAPRFTPFSQSQGKGLRADLASGSGSVVFACWMKTSLPGRDFLQICNRFTGAGGAAFVLNVDLADGTLRGTAFLGDDVSPADFGSVGKTTNLADGKDHLVAVILQNDGGVYASIDGGTPGSGFSFGSIVSSTVDLYDRIVAGGFKDPTGGAVNLFDGSISHVWVKRTSSMPDWSFAYSAGSGATESTTDRFERLRGLLFLAPIVRGSSTTQMAAQAAGGQTPLQTLRDVAAVESGIVFADRSASGTVVFECRNYRYNLASSVTLTPDDFMGDLRWSDDDQLTVNDFTARRDGGADQRVKDAASIASYGVYADGESQPWASDDDALAVAQWRVSNGAEVPPRVTEVSVMVNAIASWSSVLGLDISSVVTLSGLPAQSPFTSVTLHVEGYSEYIGVNEHRVTLNTSPAEINEVWQLGVAGHSELGVTTRFGL
ncbi:carbohydrate binding domain-containing protein [Microbispora rosea]|uniref:carbohydrate binding domain-containing protein n=1 Tax=Microbispora rosea TaxID=58117 RepID=UPI0037A7FCE2